MNKEIILKLLKSNNLPDFEIAIEILSKASHKQLMDIFETIMYNESICRIKTKITNNAIKRKYRSPRNKFWVGNSGTLYYNYE